MIQYWVRGQVSEKWHAWPYGGHRTYCGRINVEHLRTQSAIEILQSVPTDGDICIPCAKKLGLVTAPACGDPNTAAWILVLRLHLRRAHINVADASIEQLAVLLAEVGSPDEVAAREVYEEVQLLLLKPTWLRGRKRIAILPHLKEALSKLPTAGDLLRVAKTVRAWRDITHHDLNTDNFRSDRVIEIMLQVPSPEPYIRHLNTRGLPNLAAMFHPNTLERAKKEPTLRGLFGGSTEYWDQTTQQLNIVSD